MSFDSVAESTVAATTSANRVFPPAHDARSIVAQARKKATQRQFVDIPPSPTRDLLTMAQYEQPVVVPPSIDRSFLDQIEYGATPCIVAGWELDPENPKAPSIEAWGRMTEAQHLLVDSWLMAWLNDRRDESMQSVLHNSASEAISAVLRAHLKRKGVSAYVGLDIMTHFPSGEIAGPDVMVVLGPDGIPSRSWHVGIDGKLPNVCFDVFVHGDEAKDTTRNVEMYARVGVREYFVFQPELGELVGYRLTRGGKKCRQLTPDRSGRLLSQELGLTLKAKDGHVEFYEGGAVVLTSKQAEIAAIQLTDEKARRADDEARRAKDEAKHADDEARRAKDEASLRTADEQRLAEAERRATEAERRLLELERHIAGLPSGLADFDSIA